MSINDLLGKLSSYNLFNYFLPGTLFAVAAQTLTGYSFAQHGLLESAFVYYFIGLVVSRFGSLVLEPLLKRLSFVRFASYEEFVVASKQDAKLELISEANNTYRTLCSLVLLLGVLKLYELLEASHSSLRDWNTAILFALVFLLMLFSYRKQTAYVTKRVEANRVGE